MTGNPLNGWTLENTSLSDNILDFGLCDFFPNHEPDNRRLTTGRIWPSFLPLLVERNIQANIAITRMY